VKRKGRGREGKGGKEKKGSKGGREGREGGREGPMKSVKPRACNLASPPLRLTATYKFALSDTMYPREVEM